MGGASSSRCNIVNRTKLRTVMAESGCLNEVNYNHERGLKRHTEDNSPKYRMVGKMISILRSFACAQDDENLIDRATSAR